MMQRRVGSISRSNKSKNSSSNTDDIQQRQNHAVVVDHKDDTSNEDDDDVLLLLKDADDDTPTILLRRNNNNAEWCWTTTTRRNKQQQQQCCFCCCSPSSSCCCYNTNIIRLFGHHRAYYQMKPFNALCVILLGILTFFILRNFGFLMMTLEKDYVLPLHHHHNQHHHHQWYTTNNKVNHHGIGFLKEQQHRKDEKIECWNFQKKCAMLLNQHTSSNNNNTNITSHDNNNTSRHHRGRRYDNHHGGSNNNTIGEPAAASKTLALNDPMLRDGYRNQFMRFVTLIIYALEHGFDEILLPSIQWNCDHRKREFQSVGFEYLFDVDYWNEYRHNKNGISIHLPRMVPYNESEHYDWDPFTGLYHGACDVLDTYIQDDGKGKHIIFERTGHYQHPPSFGGGTALGRLFADYSEYDNTANRPQNITIQQHHNSKNTTSTMTTTTTVSFLDIEAQIIQAMRPSATLERILQQTLTNNNNGGQPPYIALHARIEPEMLVHNMCTDQKVFNLTTIFNMIRTMDHNADMVAANPSLYIAIGLPEMLEVKKYKKFQLEQNLNMVALQDALHNGLELPLIGQNLTVSAGAHVAIDNSTVDSCANEIVSSVISFEIAVRANIFIGTYISTWSTTVWKARHALGRGGNYAYTPGGLVNITGVPPPFQC